MSSRVPSAAAIFEQQLLEARILRRVNTAAAQLEPIHVLNVLCAEIAKALQADSAAFGRLIEHKAAIEIIAEYRTNGSSAIGILLPLSGNDITPKVLAERRPFVIQDVKNAIRFGDNREAALSFGIQSMLIVPVLAGDDVVGTLGVDSYTLRDFSPADQNLAMSLIQAAIPALKQTHMIEALRNELHERQKIESALRRSQTRFIDLVNNIEGMVFEGEIKNGVSKLTFVSQHSEQILGYPIDWWFQEPEWASKPVHPEDREIVLKGMQKSAEQKSAVDMEYRMLRADRSVVWVRTLAKVEDNGEYLFWRGLTTDITSLKKQQLLEQDRNRVLELMAQGAKLNTILDTVAELLFRQFGLACGITIYQDATVRLLSQVGIPEAALSWMEYIQLNENALEMRQTLRHGQPYAFLLGQSTIFPNELAEQLALHQLTHAVLLPMRLATGEVRGGMAFFSASPFDLANDPRITSSCDLAAIAIERDRLLASLEYQALHDILTGLPNRALYNSHLEKTIAHAERNSSRFALFSIDLNQFKQINDTFGHTSGDVALVAVARALEACVRASDVVARLGGDEFCIIAPDLKNHNDAILLLEKIQLAVQSIQLEPNIQVSASVGYSLYPDDATSSGMLYSLADRAMYRQKKHYEGSSARG